MSQTTITFRIFRYRAGEPDSGRFEQVDLPVEQSTTVLDVLAAVRSTDSTLMFRHSCHHGSCGTCACRINGRERLACLTRVLDLNTPMVTVEPLNKLHKLGDLVVDPADFFREYPSDWQTLRHSEANPEAIPPEEVSAYMRLENCIECGACVSACPVEDFLGPAVLAGLNRERLNRQDLDGEQDDGRLHESLDREKPLLELAAGERGVVKCRRALECSRVCPTGVYPARHIEELRRWLSTPS
jgi:succinate dehydrogenase / fumarate reductase iron-sulfur subunit